MRSINCIIDEWYETIYSADGDAFLDFAQGLNINEFVIEDGVRTIWLEDGMHYIPHGACIKEIDSDKARAIINELEEYGIEFENRG